MLGNILPIRLNLCNVARIYINGCHCRSQISDTLPLSGCQRQER